MKKYLVIILLILLIYTVYQCWKLATVTTEGFADASVPTNVDTNNSIATLAQVAKDLQEGGGLKVPGNLNVIGSARINKFYKNSGANSDGIEFLHDNGTAGIGLGYNHIYATGSSVNVDLGLQAKGTGAVWISGKNIIAEIMGLRNDLTATNNSLRAEIDALKATNATLRADLDDRTRLVWYPYNTPPPQGYTGNIGSAPGSGGTLPFRVRN